VGKGSFNSIEQYARTAATVNAGLLPKGSAGTAQ
jgi:hypothetical protein